MLGVLVAAVAVLLLLASPAAAAERAPAGWLRTMADGPLLDPGFDNPSEYDLMVRSGVGGVRVGVPWITMQPERDGPIDYSVVDVVLQQTAPRGIDVLPVVTFAPAWAARHPGESNSPPEGTENYARFAETLVRRYGPGGSFWAEHPELPARPIRRWQIWNEPNQPVFNWSDQPFAADYVALLRAARERIKAVDPGAQIVQAGLVGTSWEALESIYRAGGRGLFDVVAIHPFTLDPDNTVEILRRVRRVMTRFRDARTPMALTELTWPAAKGEPLTRTYGYETTDAGQAQRLRQVLPKLLDVRRRYRIESVYWFSWISEAPFPRNDPFSYSGLRQRESGSDVRSRPSLRIYARYARRP
jgi:hypothetical protein